MTTSSELPEEFAGVCEACGKWRFVTLVRYHQVCEPCIVNQVEDNQAAAFDRLKEGGS